MRKRSFSYIGQVRTILRLPLKELAAQAGITHEYLSKLEKKRSEPGISIALRLALAVGLRIDDVLNLYDGLERLLSERRPLFRLPHTIQHPEIIKLIAELNQPSVLEGEYYSVILGAADNRITTMLDLAQRLAHMEKATPSYQAYQRAEFVPLAQRSLELDLPDQLELGQAYSALLEQQKITAHGVFKKTGLSRHFLADLVQNRAEVSVVNLDLASWAVGVTVDELLFIAYPQLAKLKWPFFIQALPTLETYQNQEIVRLLTSPATLETFEQAEVYERTRMMLGYKSWWLAEAQLRESAAAGSAGQAKVFTPAVFRFLTLKEGAGAS